MTFFELLLVWFTRMFLDDSVRHLVWLGPLLFMLTCPGGFVKAFPHDVTIERSSHGKLGESVGKSRASVKSILIVQHFYKSSHKHNADYKNKKIKLTLLPFLRRK